MVSLDNHFKYSTSTQQSILVSSWPKTSRTCWPKIARPSWLRTSQSSRSTTS